MFIQFPFLGVNSESGNKLNSFSRECILLGFEEEDGLLFPSEAFTFTKLGVKEISSNTKVLAVVNDTWRAGICEEAKDFCVQKRVSVTVKYVKDAFL